MVMDNNKHFDNDKVFYVNSPMTAAIDVTKMCNYNCLHCYNDSGKKPNDELNDEEMMDVIKQIANFHCTSVCLCGGEPMLRKNILDMIKCLSLSSGSVNMVSNGSMVNNKIAKDLKNAGLSLIQFSLDGISALQHDTFRGYSGAYDKVISAIKASIDAGIETIVAFSPNKLNYSFFPEYVDMCISFGINEIRLMPLIPIGRGAQLDSLLLSSEDYINLQRQIEIAKLKYKFHATIEWGDPLDHYARMPNNYHIGIKTYCFEVLSNGDITPSSYLPISFGNVKRHSLQEYWNNGFDNIWGNNELLKCTEKIKNIYDIQSCIKNTFKKDKVKFDLIDDNI